MCIENVCNTIYGFSKTKIIYFKYFKNPKKEGKILAYLKLQNYILFLDVVVMIQSKFNFLILKFLLPKNSFVHFLFSVHWRFLFLFQKIAFWLTCVNINDCRVYKITDYIFSSILICSYESKSRRTEWLTAYSFLYLFW